MNWRKIVFTNIEDYQPIHNQIDLALVKDPIRYQDVCVCSTYPLDSLDDESDDDPTITAYFSPDAIRYFSEMIAPYPSEPCGEPFGMKVSCLCVDREKWSFSREHS